MRRQLEVAQNVDLQRAETAAEVHLLLRRDALVAEHQQVVVQMRLVDALEIVVRQGAVQVQPKNFGAEWGVE
jgi:hypothetical protein